MATYSCILAWRILWTEKPGGLQSMGLQRVMGTTEQLTHCGLNPSPLYWRHSVLTAKPPGKSLYHFLHSPPGNPNAGDTADAGAGKVLWNRTWQPTPVFLPGKPHGQRSLTGYSPRGHKSDVTERLALSHLILHIKLLQGIDHIPVLYVTSV